MQSALISIRRGSIVACLPKSPAQRPSDPLSVACDQVLNAGGTRGLRRPLDPAAPGTPRRESVSSWRTPSASRSTGVVARRPCRLPLHWGRPRLYDSTQARGSIRQVWQQGAVSGRLSPEGGVLSMGPGLCVVRRTQQVNWQGSATALTTAYEVRIRHGGGAVRRGRRVSRRRGIPASIRTKGNSGGSRTDPQTSDARAAAHSAWCGAPRSRKGRRSHDRDL